MTGSRQSKEGGAKAALIAALEDRLGTAMGVRLTLLEKLIGTSAAPAIALAWLLLYGALAGLVLWWTNDGRMPAEVGHARIASLTVWNALHFPVLVAVTVVATRRVLDIVRRDILPFASDDYAAAVGAALARRYSAADYRLMPYAVAPAVVAAALWSIRGDIAPLWWTAPRFPLDLAFWTATILYYAFLSMRVTLTTTFPLDFAAALERERQNLYPPRAVDSPLVQGLARLNRTLLVYSALIFLVLATIMLLVVLPAESFRLPGHSRYLFVVIPLLAFFSVGLGTLVYLGSESAIAVALRRFSLERAQALQDEIIALLDRPGDEASSARIERLSRLHDQIIAGGRYGSRAGKIVSVALPLTMPAIGLIERLFSQPAPPTSP